MVYGSILDLLKGFPLHCSKMSSEQGFLVAAPVRSFVILAKVLNLMSHNR